MDNQKQTPTAVPQAPPPEQTSNEPPLSTRGQVVILLLMFATFFGIIFMWMWMKKWPKWLKILITLPTIMSILLAIAFFGIIISFPGLISNLNSTLNLDNEPATYTTSAPTITQTPIPTIIISPTTNPEQIKQDIKNAMATGSYGDLLPYFANEVSFILEASEGTPPANPEGTVRNMSYFYSAKSPWDFDQNNPIIQQIKTEYPDEYGNLFVGIASDEFIAGFGFNNEGLIEKIRAGATYKLLISE